MSVYRTKHRLRVSRSIQKRAQMIVVDTCVTAPSSAASQLAM